jgi:hypothetical protein
MPAERESPSSHRDRNDFGSDITECDGGAKISGIFHPYWIVFFEKKACEEIQRLLHSGNND